MTFLGPLTRAAALAGLLLSAGFSAAPAFAGPAEVALLKSYIGEWRGRGTLVGASTESVVCRLSLSQGNSDKVNYSGRCTLAGTNLSVAGTIAYVDASRRYEAAVGQKRGSGLVFNLRDRTPDEAGKEMNISAQIALNGDAISVAFEVVYVESGDSLRADVPFAR